MSIQFSGMYSLQVLHKILANVGEDVTFPGSLELILQRARPGRCQMTKGKEISHLKMACCYFPLLLGVIHVERPINLVDGWSFDTTISLHWVHMNSKHTMNVFLVPDRIISQLKTFPGGKGERESVYATRRVPFCSLRCLPTVAGGWLHCT